jgi:hypothetical protein
MHPIFNCRPISGTWSGTVSPSQMCAVHFYVTGVLFVLHSLTHPCYVKHFHVESTYIVVPCSSICTQHNSCPVDPWYFNFSDWLCSSSFLSSHLTPSFCVASTITSLQAKLSRKIENAWRSARPKPVPPAIPEISSRQFLDGNVSVACDTGDQLVPRPYHLQYQRSARDSFRMETYQ